MNNFIEMRTDIVIEYLVVSPEGEVADCTRCGREVESDSLVSYGDWKLCELCQGDI